MTSTAFDDQFAVCTPEEEEAFCAIEARQREADIVRPSQRERFEAWAKQTGFPLGKLMGFGSYIDSTTQSAWIAWQAAAPKPEDA